MKPESCTYYLATSLPLHLRTHQAYCHSGPLLMLLLSDHPPAFHVSGHLLLVPSAVTWGSRIPVYEAAGIFCFHVGLYGCGIHLLISN